MTQAQRNSDSSTVGASDTEDSNATRSAQVWVFASASPKSENETHGALEPDAAHLPRRLAVRSPRWPATGLRAACWKVIFSKWALP